MFYMICLLLASFAVAHGAKLHPDLLDRISQSATSDGALRTNAPRIGCTCIHYVCHCCTNATLPNIFPKVQVCVRMTYIPEDFEMDFTLTFNNILLLNRTAAVTSAPEECVAVKYYGNVCLQMFDLKAGESFFSACARLKLSFTGGVWFDITIGCFRMVPEIASNKEKHSEKEVFPLTEIAPAHNKADPRPPKLENNHCQCVGDHCGCCKHFDIPEIRVDNTACVNTTYLPNGYELSFTLSYGGKVYVNKTAPVSSVATECVGVQRAQICPQMFDMKASPRFLSGCVRLALQIGPFWLDEVIGCFKMVPKNASNKEKSSKKKALTLTGLLVKPRPPKPSSKHCQCVGVDCGCCQHFDIPKIGLNDTACVNVTYLAADYGISLTFSIDGKVYLNETISARNPPPVCFGIPYLKKYADICIKFYNLDITDKVFAGCIELEARLKYILVEKLDIGCFKLPLGKKAVEGSLPLLWTPLVKAKDINQVTKEENYREAFKKVLHRIAIQKEYPGLSERVIENN